MKKMLGLVILFFFIGSLTSWSIVQAGDDDDHKDQKEYKYGKYDNHDEDEYDEYNEEDDFYYNSNSNTGLEEGKWYLWNRGEVSYKAELPFKDAKYVTLKTVDSVETLSSYIIPLQGEYFIPGKIVSQFLGATANFYEKSSILEITSLEIELIFRANTNVAYESGIKTRLPGKAFYLNKDVYVPISVIANGLGYAVEWNELENTFVFQAL